MMKKASAWVNSMRLRTLPLSVSGIILASCLAAREGYFSWTIFILAILTTLSFQILSNLANDYGDGLKGTDNEQRIGPERAIQSGKITPKEMRTGIIINVILALIFSVILIFTAFGTSHGVLVLIFLILGIASIAAAIKYTVGNSAYGYHGLGDIFVFIFFGLVSVIGGYVLFAKSLTSIVYLPAVVIGLLSAGVLNLNNLRDIVSDEASNKNTLAVKLGVKSTKIYHNVLIISALALSALFGILYFQSYYSLMFIISFIPLLQHLNRFNKNKVPKLLDPELKKLALSTVLLAILMGLGQVF
ncbi:1,4-dihydroxy-2-naphthoate octaprenyltransferase [Gaetbulibacter aestuarii]|uniref:1,4-dihydroxy-2-naphthoate octaprenyltransferase n=1 Tax=Gaetbulibacter aestuarii TaxID=1502358 RepID=A0ABW7MZF2_9FLAO